MSSIDLWLKKYFLFTMRLKSYVKQKNSIFFRFFFTFVIIGTSVNAAVSWTQLGSDIDGEAANDNAGYSVSLSADGSMIAIGAHRNGGENGSVSGHVRIYEYIAGSWTQLGSDIDGEARDDYSGYSVSLSGDGSRIAIGAYGNDGNGTSSGHARIYEYSAGSWTQLGSDIDGEAAGDLSGYSVSLSADGSRIAIGAILNNGGNGADSGHARIYEYIAGSWTQLGSDIDGEMTSDRSGNSVSLSADGSRVAIGAYFNDGNGTSSGHARIYEYSSAESWIQLGSDIDGEAAGDESGFSVSLSADGSRVAIGAYGNDGNGTSSGHARIYEYSAGSWTQLGSDIDGEAAGDQSGYSVSLSDDGSRIAIGARYNDGRDTNAGHARIYKYSAGSWTQLGSDINAEAAGDQSGYSVSLSADGSRIAIGAPYNDESYTNAGHARIYEFLPTCGNTITALTEYKWWSVSRPCGISTDPTIKELFSNPDGSGLGIYGDENDWVMWKLDGTNPDGTEKYTMITDSSEVMKLGVGYWIITSKTGVKWNPGATAETLDPTGAYWNVSTTGTVGQTSLNGINAPDVKEFLVVDPITDGGLTLIQDTQLALIGNPFPKKITWSNVYFSNNGTDYTAIDSIPSGVQPIAYVSDPDSTSGQKYKAVSSAPGFTNIIEPNQAFWIQMTGTVERHTLKRIALPLEY